MRYRPILALLALAAAAVCADPAHAQERPLRGDGRGAYYQGFPFGNSFFPEVYGSGEFLHLGRSALYIRADPLQALLHERFVSVQAFLFSASNDYSYCTVSGEFDPSGDFMLATVTFAGGTGRFANASGQATLLMVFWDPWTPYASYDFGFDFLLDGTINY
jgi:hypothetical protein